jgi:hypothetical protein
LLVAVASLFSVLAAAASGARGASPLALTGRVFADNELAGFAAKRPPVSLTDISAWAKVAPTGGIDVAARLRHAGFVAGVREDLIWTNGNDRGALAAVVRLGSPGAAQAEIAQQLHDFAGEPHRGRAKTYAAFPVPGIPGAHGFALTTAETSGLNIIFADGPYTYHLGVGWGNQVTNPPTRTQLIAAVGRLYRRVHPRPAP